MKMNSKKLLLLLLNYQKTINNKKCQIENRLKIKVNSTIMVQILDHI